MKKTILPILICLLCAFSVKAQGQGESHKKKIAVNTDNIRNGLYVPKVYDIETNQNYYDFDAIMHDTEKRIFTENVLKEYLAAYPEMYNSKHAAKLKRAYPAVFAESYQKMQQKKLSGH